MQVQNLDNALALAEYRAKLLNQAEPARYSFSWTS